MIEPGRFGLGRADSVDHGVGLGARGAPENASHIHGHGATIIPGMARGRRQRDQAHANRVQEWRWLRFPGNLGGVAGQVGLH